MSITINPTAKARLPLATAANFGRNGAPAAVPSNSKARVQRLVEPKQSCDDESRRWHQDEIRQQCEGDEPAIPKRGQYLARR